MSTVPEIVTPEAVALDIERAGVASRVLAITIDFLAVLAVWIVLTIVVSQIFASIEGVSGAVYAALTSVGLWLAWFTGFETLMQRTPGKAALGLRVVGLDGTPVRFQQAFLRAVLGLVDFLLIPIGFVAVVTTLLSPRDQRLGDIGAGTLVVRERHAGAFVAPARFPPPPGYEGYVASLDIGAMTVDQYGLVRMFLLRAHRLNPVARVQLAVRLANPLSRILHHLPPNYLHPEAFLLCVAAAWQRAHGGAQALADAYYPIVPTARAPLPPPPQQNPHWPAHQPIPEGPYGSGPYASGPYGSAPQGPGPQGGPYGAGGSSGPYGSGPQGSGPYGPAGSGPYGSGGGPRGSGPSGSGQGNGPYGSGGGSRGNGPYGGGGSPGPSGPLPQPGALPPRPPRPEERPPPPRRTEDRPPPPQPPPPPPPPPPAD